MKRLYYLVLQISEIEVDSTLAIDAVVKSDKHRLALMEEEAQLIEKLEEGDISVGERLKEVIVRSCSYECSAYGLLYLVKVAFSLKIIEIPNFR